MDSVPKDVTDSPILGKSTRLPLTWKDLTVDILNQIYRDHGCQIDSVSKDVNDLQFWGRI